MRNRILPDDILSDSALTRTMAIFTTVYTVHSNELSVGPAAMISIPLVQLRHLKHEEEAGQQLQG
jgi:hypothetical protein